MSRTIAVFDLAVVVGTLVIIAYNKRNRGSGCVSFKDTGKNFYRIRLFSGGSKFALTWFPAVKKCLYIITGKWNACRTAIDNNAKCRTVGFPPGCDRE